MVRKATRPIYLEDVISTAFEDDGSLLNPTLRGHLVVEALLVELIATIETGEHVWKWGFPRKTQFAVDRGLIGANLKIALDLFNGFRNDFAHIFGFQAGVQDVHKLARDLEQHGVDFSDSVGHQAIDNALHSYDNEAGILQEIIWCLSYEVACKLIEHGGRNLFAA